jgi:membrane associated rhomboid family serine protease
VPLSDRDYMKPSPPPRRRIWTGAGFGGFNLTPLWVLIGINLVLFIATLINDNVLFQLGLVPSLFRERPWTIVTNMFVHAGFWHLFGNMLTLFYFGRALLQLVGQNKFLLLYFGGGILGNILYIWLGAPQSIAIGASGAVYAIAGALAIMIPRVRVFAYFIIPMPLWLLVLVFFVLWSFIPGVAWQAHIGGLVAGLIAGFFFRKRTRYVY